MTIPQARPTQIEAVLFDKDGTLLDFHRTWDPVVGAVLDRLADGDDDVHRRAAEAIGYDVHTRAILPGSPVIAESNETIAALLAPSVQPVLDEPVLAVFNRLALELCVGHAAEAAGAGTTLSTLAARGLRLGVATNDAEQIARHQIEALGWTAHFETVVGYDSGHGSKPAPGMLLACLDHLGLDARACLFVGDSRHDIDAARAAGITPVLIDPTRSVAPLSAPEVTHIAGIAEVAALPQLSPRR